ncbi:MAG: V-type ATP synthase subunit F, partial [Firmicutes bacterium]|nr:V-type ATP synthase subunit F [Bacillota bacterium]
MYRIGIIGDRESVLGFKAVGLEVFTCDQADEARKILRKIGKEDFAIIYVTEVLAEQISEEIDKYKDERIPA